MKLTRRPALRFTAVLFVVLFSLSLTQEAAAQNLSVLTDERRSETRATLAFTIPLGGTANESEAQPSLELKLNSRRYDREDETMRWRQDDHTRLEPVQFGTNLGITFGRRKTLLLNGNSVASFGPRLHANDEKDEEGRGISTGVLIGIGVATLLVGGIALAADETRDSLRDSINPD